MKAVFSSGSNFIFHGVFYLHVSCEKAMSERDRIYFEKGGRESNHVHQGLRNRKVLQASRCRSWISIELDSHFERVGLVERSRLDRTEFGSIICEHIIDSCVEALFRSIMQQWQGRISEAPATTTDGEQQTASNSYGRRINSKSKAELSLRAILATGVGRNRLHAWVAFHNK